MRHTETQQRLGTLLTCAVVFSLLVGSTLAPAVTASTPVSANEYTADPVASTATAGNTASVTVSGTVTYPNGTAAENVTLQWDGVNGTSDFDEVVTDAQGHFSAELDAPGDYHVSYWQGDIEAGNVTYPRDGVADFGNLGLVSVSNETTTNYTLPVGHPLNVTTENESGAPVQTEVGLSDHHPETDERTYFHGYRDGGVPTDSQGLMKHPSNPHPGVEVNGTVGAYAEEPAGTEYSGNYSEYDVQGPRNETLILHQTTTVSGTVQYPNGTAASNVTLRWWTDENGDHLEQAVTGPNGSYTAELWENRKYEVTMWQGDLREADESGVKFPRDGVADFGELGWVNTTTTNETRNYTLPVGHVLNVTVENESGASIENASVGLADTDDGIWTSAYSYLHEDGLPTDAQGRMYHPPNSGVGLEVNGTIDVTARPPEGTSYPSNETDVSVTTDRDVTLTLETKIEGRWVDTTGTPVEDATVYVINFSTGVVESTTTDSDGGFSASVPDGNYRVYVQKETTGNGVADSWSVPGVTVSGATDVGNLTVPNGYATTVDVADRDGEAVDAYIDVRGGNGGWLYTYGHGRSLDRPSQYDTRTADLTNGSHSVTAFDSWTHDVLGSGFLTVAGTNRTATVSVDRFNGTRTSGAVGTTVVRDLQSPTDDQSVQDVLNESVNVRLFVLDATTTTELHVTEELPDGYELNGTTANVSADGSGRIENVTYADGTLSFDVRGEVSQIRYRAVPTGEPSSAVRFAGEFGTTPTVGQTALPAETNVSVFAPADGTQVATANPTLRFVTRHPDAANVTDLEYRIDGGSWQGLGGTPAIGGVQLSGLDDGQHTVTVRLVNENGTVVTDTTTFAVDTA